MAKYINKFKNQGEYELQIFNLDYPNINYIESGDTVVWQKTKPPHMVEISNGSTTWYGGVLKSGQSNEITRAIVSEMNVTSINECTSLVISDGVTSIGDEAFKDGSNQYPSSVEHLVLPSSVASFGNGALSFVGDNITPSSEEMIDLPNTVTSIGENAFERCPFIRSANITNPNFTAIANFAFYNCHSLTSVTIGNSVTTIGESAFQECSGLTSVTIPSSVTSISSNAFRLCKNLASIDFTLPSSISSIGTSAFTSCENLTSIAIPDSVTSIGDNAFYDCHSLTSVTIGNSVTSIGQWAFYFCLALTSITVNATTPPTLGYGAFADTNNCPIYVPAASVDAYKAATNWSTYASRIQAIPSE